MPDALRSTMRPLVGALVLSLFCGATTRAQVSPSPGVATAPSTPAFLARYDFHLAAAALSTADDHFTWDAHFGGDVDLVDYVRGRVNVLIDYDAILGREYRPFDPYIGNYTLEASASARAGSAEFAGVFHHLSQHLSDRPKRFGIAWNVLQARMSRRLAAAGSTIDVQVGAGPIVQRSYVDYSWTGNVDLLIRRPLTQQLSMFVHGRGELYGVDHAIAGRTAQRGGVAQAGVRLSGRAGAVELFAGVEQRVDADPLTWEPRRWALAGFRLVSR